MKPSGCPTEVVPSRLFKEIWETIGPNIQMIMNSSLASGVAPATFKYAVVQPFIKQSSLETSVLSNSTPISKVSFLSKLLEKTVLT